MDERETKYEEAKRLMREAVDRGDNETALAIRRFIVAFYAPCEPIEREANA